MRVTRTAYYGTVAHGTSAAGLGAAVTRPPPTRAPRPPFLPGHEAIKLDLVPSNVAGILQGVSNTIAALGGVIGAPLVAAAAALGTTTDLPSHTHTPPPVHPLLIARRACGGLHQRGNKVVARRFSPDCSHLRLGGGVLCHTRQSRAHPLTHSHGWWACGTSCARLTVAGLEVWKSVSVLLRAPMERFQS